MNTNESPVTYPLTIVNEVDGSTSAHKAGCRDLGKARQQFCSMFNMSAASKREVFLNYNDSFIQEAIAMNEPAESNCYPIDFKACCAHVPVGE